MDHAAQTIKEDDDADLVARVVAGEVEAFAGLMRRYNRRVFRIVRAIVQDDAEAEDACQDAWLRAYRHLGDLQMGAAFSAWLGRIAMRCALSHRRPRVVVSLDVRDEPRSEPVEPEDHAGNGEIARRIEHAVDELEPSYRAVVLLRDIEHMTTTETAAVLGLTEENVRVRLHRAHACLRERLFDALGPDAQDVFRFDGERCVRLTAAVVGAIGSHRDCK